MRTLLLATILLSLLLLLACSSDQDQSEPSSSDSVSESATTPDPMAAQSGPPQPLLRVLILGDSLTAGYGIDEEEAYPQVLEDLMHQRGLPLRVINAGVSGDTLADGRERLDWVLQQEVDWVVVALGANDGMRGQDLSASRATLDAIIAAIQERGLPLLLAGMSLPSNYGEEYREEFEAMYTQAAEKHEVPLLPFLLEGVAMQEEYNLADGIHPNPQGHQRIARTVADVLEPLLRHHLANAVKEAADE